MAERQRAPTVTESLSRLKHLAGRGGRHRAQCSNSDGIAFAIETYAYHAGVPVYQAPTVTESLSRLKLCDAWQEQEAGRELQQ